MQSFSTKVLLLYGCLNLGFLVFATGIVGRSMTLLSETMFFVYYMLMFLGSFFIVKLSIEQLQDNMHFEQRTESTFIWYVYYCCLITNAMLASVLVMFFTWLVLFIMIIAYSEYTGTNVFNIELM